MKNGLYSVEFGVAGNVGAGVLVYRDGKVSGGDTGFAYAGNVEDKAGQLSGSVEIFQHHPGMDNVFQGLTNFKLDVQGTASGDGAKLNGTTSSAPGATLTVVMKLLRAD